MFVKRGMLYKGFFLTILYLAISSFSIAVENIRALEGEKSEQEVIEAMRADKTVIDEMIAEKAPLEEVLAAKVEFIYKHSPFDAGIPDIISNYEVHSIVPLAINLTKDTNKRVRFYGYRLLISAKQKTNDLNLLNIIIHAFIEGLKDDNNSGTCLKVLMDCHKNEFSEETKEYLKQLLDEILTKEITGTYSENILLLVGVADMQEEMNKLQAIMDIGDGNSSRSRSNPHRMVFAALKAKARMGDKDAIRQCIAQVDMEQDEERKLRISLKHIAYIRQPEAVDYIKQYIYSDKKTRDLGPDALGGSYSDIAAGYLEEMIVGFPNRAEIANHIKEYGFDEAFTEKWPTYMNDGGRKAYVLNCRQWLEAQDSLEIIR